MKKRHVIIGNGCTAINAILSIRGCANGDEIFLISKEPSSAYSPMLTTYYLKGRIAFRDLFICDGRFYQRNKVQTILGKQVVGIDRSLKEVKLEDGNSVPYDTLLIATGSSPILPKIEGIRLPHVTGLRTLEDAKRIKTLSIKAKDIVLLGGGLVSLQVLDALYQPDLRFTLVVKSPHLLSRMVDEEGAQIIEERLRSFGVRIFKRSDARRVTREKVILQNGSELQADMVVVGKGVKPNTPFLKGTGVKVSTGIVVDEAMRTDVGDIYAAGDVVEARDPISHQWELNPTWPNAVTQARVAGLHMAGREGGFIRENIRMNVSTLLGLTFATFGSIHGEGEEDHLVKKDGSIYRKLIYKKGLLIGGILVGEFRDAGILLNFVEQRKRYVNLKADMAKGDVFLAILQNFCTRRDS